MTMLLITKTPPKAISNQQHFNNDLTNKALPENGQATI